MFFYLFSVHFCTFFRHTIYMLLFGQDHTYVQSGILEDYQGIKTTFIYLFNPFVPSAPFLYQGIIQEKYGRIEFLQNKKANVPKTRKTAGGGSMEHCKSQIPPKSVDLFCLKHGKKGENTVKISQQSFCST